MLLPQMNKIKVIERRKLEKNQMEKLPQQELILKNQDLEIIEFHQLSQL